MLPWLLAAAGAAAAFMVAVRGARAWLGIRAALRLAELDLLSPPQDWPWARALCGLCAAAPVLVAVQGTGQFAWLSACVAAAIAFAVAPQFLDAARRAVQLEIRDDLPIHADLMALAAESGSSLSSVIGICLESAPDGALRRAWLRVVREIHAGDSALDALKALEQRVDLAALSSLIGALRVADRNGVELAPVLQERARHFAAQKFARAERQARAAPLKLWATLMLCIVPCGCAVLAFPLASLLARVLGRG